MPRYDEIEHEGTEDFNVFQNRDVNKEVKKQLKVFDDKKAEDQLEKLQEKWMSLDNPFLWEGDIDT